jgi:FkbM family methyltransferase
MMNARGLRAWAVTATKKVLYGSRGEPIEYGSHKLRYLVGSRPVRLKYASSDDVVARNDAMQIQFFLDRVRPGQLVLDVGGHYGEYAVLFAALVGSEGRVISFEPDAAASPVLTANVALNGFTDRVTVESLAAFDTSETRQLFSRHGNSQSSLARAGLGGATTEADVERYTISTVSLDEYLQRNGHPPPSYLKLDVEGAEIHVLRGAVNILRSQTTILCELHPYAWNEFGVSFDDLLRLVRETGRTIRYLDATRRTEDGPSYGAVVIE